MAPDETKFSWHAEKIVLCIDAVEETLTNRHPIVEGGKSFSTFGIIKKCVEIFLQNKAAINPKNEFSLMMMKASSLRMTPFTSNVNLLVRTLNGLTADPVPEQPTSLSRIFKYIRNELKSSEEEMEDLRSLRIILLFGRQGQWINDETISPFTSNVVIDILYLHKPFLCAKEKKRTEANFNVFQSCVGELSFCKITLACTYNTFVHMADLLIHPQLRK